ncbi:hypothetical protein H8356DRAFT_957775 [Neocallimastix lanati (nom. inval.)]|uniref:Uncharacterized protein n=1 Tax=Neocallimastix californiae TaxID=1754190 RepID=A0A1Y2CV11_9FUNG|nr:hypothetical protein H8356DRAFT_957775 [Neocallimastix sp. JGI-2020a]ORY50155.1 hypothetical protein LY90DRAFT_670786 [Neocallimastix californiae]|eukprot:ORY50155.1 hypothetical protein LY90DRAFT_670786 [Neocallimastix californiae]
MCKKTLDNEDSETSNDNQHFSLNANTDFGRIFKLIEDKIKSLSLNKDWELYFDIKDKFDNGEETKDNTKEIMVLDAEMAKEIEENDKYSIFKKFIIANTELLKQQDENKTLNNSIKELEKEVKINKEKYNNLYNTNNELIEEIQEKKASISNISRELIDTKGSYNDLKNEYVSLKNEVISLRDKNSDLENLLCRKDKEIAKLRDELSNLFMLAEQTIRMENDYSKSNLTLPPMKEENKSSMLSREKYEMKDGLMMGRRLSINSMAVFTPPTSPITHSNNPMIQNGQKMNGSLLHSKMNNYNLNGMNNNYNSGARNNMNSSGNTGNVGNRPRGRPSHKENNINESSKRLKPIAVNPNISSSSSSSSHILSLISSSNVPRMLNNGSQSQNYRFSGINDNNVLPALNHSHSQENIELPSIPVDIQRTNGMDGYNPSYNGKGSNDLSINDSKDYPFSSRIKNENNENEHNDLMRNGNNDMTMNAIPANKRKNSYSYQQSQYNSGKVSRKNSQSGGVPIQPQQNKKQKYYQQLQPQTSNIKGSSGGNGKHSNGSSSLSNTPISSPSSSSSSSGSQNNTPKETKHVSPSAYVRWRTNEDDLLRSLVKKMGPKQWDKIAEEIPGRTYHQCRQRWVNTLSKKFPEDKNTKNKNYNQLHHHNSSPKLEKDEEGEIDEKNSKFNENERDNKHTNEKNDMDTYTLNRGMKRKRPYIMNGSLNKKIHSAIEQNNIEMPLTPQSISSEGSGNENNSRKGETASTNSSPTSLINTIAINDNNMDKGNENMNLTSLSRDNSKMSSSNDEKNFSLPQNKQSKVMTSGFNNMSNKKEKAETLDKSESINNSINENIIPVKAMN